MSTAVDEFLSRHPELLEVDETDTPSLDLLVRFGVLLEVWHRFRLDGVERLPKGACLLVANHSVGAFSEGLLLVRALRMALPGERVRVLAHRIFFRAPLRSIGWVQRLGGRLAHPAVAMQALARGDRVLVFPGGELEIALSRGDATLVSFSGRTGFVRLARRAKVPIVPIAISGAHRGYVLLPGARWLARVLRLDRSLGVDAVPMTVGGVGIGLALLATIVFPLAAPLVPLAALQALLPLPVRIRGEVLPPITIEPGESDHDVAGRVRAALHDALVRVGRAVPRAARRRGGTAHEEARA